MTAGAHVLVVDDEPQITRGLEGGLKHAGYQVETADTKQGALDALSVRPPDAVVLDLVLPDGSGVDVCKEVRSWSGVPIVSCRRLATNARRSARVDAGADDYVTKPFGTEELLARLRAVLRRTGDDGIGARIEVGELVVDVSKREVTKAGKEVHLTPIEFDLLRVLCPERRAAR